MKLLFALRKKFDNLKYSKKLMVTFIFSILLPVSVFSIYTLYQTNRIYQKETIGVFHSNLQKEMEEFDKKTRQVNLLFQTMESNASIVSIITGVYDTGFPKYLDITSVYDPYIENLSLFNPEIQEILIYTEGSIRNSRREFREFQQFTEDFSFVPIPNKQLMYPQWIYQEGIIYVIKQVHSQGRFRNSVLVFQVDSSHLFGSNFSDYLGIGLAVQDTLGQTIYQNSFFPKEITAESTVFEETISTSGWKVQFTYDTRANALQNSSVFLASLLIILLSVSLFVLFMFLFSKPLSRRIQQLNDSIKKIIPSDFTEEISSDNTDEIGEITNTVGELVMQMRQLLINLEHTNEEKIKFEIKALQAQINPHFLYNTLSMINWRAIQQEQDEISAIATNLSRYYRGVLHQGDQLISVWDELTNTKAYMDLLLLNRDNSFCFIYEAEEQLSEYFIPSFILQPILENAVEHGIDQKKSGIGCIILKAYEEEEYIVFAIRDNGLGMSEQQIQDIFSPKKGNSSGYGLQNVNKRLDLLFEGNYEFSYKSEPSKGTDVYLKIPKFFDV